MTQARRISTTRLLDDGKRQRLFRRKLALVVLEGADAGLTLRSAGPHLTVGSAEQNDLQLHDPAVSRHHLRVEVGNDGLHLTDLGSTNGTFLGNVGLQQVVVQDVVELRLGGSLLRVMPLREEEEVPLLESDHFGGLYGRSPAMRALFAQMASVASSDVTVLIEGETGTGKELVAEEIHRHSPRCRGPFVVVDCGSIPAPLMESELFGHQRGAYTGAAEPRAGAFEEADGGTIFLDEIGELELAMQPRLLRVLEQRQVKRLGEVHYRPVNVRVIAATNRDLQRAINTGSFRADLFYRLAVVHLRVPPLRQRPEDIELLVERLLPEAAARLGLSSPKSVSAATLQEMVSYPWPGNVRELRNFLERLLTMARTTEPLDPARELRVRPQRGPSLEELAELPFRQAKTAWVESFDVAYLTRLLERCQHNVAEAARRSELDRAHLFRLIKKYGIRK